VSSTAGRRIPTIACCYLGVAISLQVQANFRELRTDDVRRIPLLRTQVNKNEGYAKGGYILTATSPGPQGSLIFEGVLDELNSERFCRFNVHQFR
jgi:hypothetical protein